MSLGKNERNKVYLYVVQPVEEFEASGDGQTPAEKALADVEAINESLLKNDSNIKSLEKQ